MLGLQALCGIPQSVVNSLWIVLLLVPTVPGMDIAPVRDGEQLDWPRLELYLRTHVAEVDGPFAVLQFPNGSANLTYLVTFGDRPLVVRRPPFGQLAPGAHDMRREYTALASLSQHFDRAPRPFLFCDDESVIGAPFLVEEYRDGVVVRTSLPPSMSHHDRAGERIGFAVVDALADLHLLDPDEIGLGSLGRPDGFAARQISGWRKRWDLVDTGRLRTMSPTGERLAETMQSPPPGGGRVSIVHNDYKVDNCQFDPADPDRVKSVFDWDMATLGDPLFDLGTLLSYWPDASDSSTDRSMYPDGLEQVGLPPRAAVIQRYAERTGFDLGGIAWYEAFATWKTTVAMEQLYQRHVRGESTDPRMVDLGARAPSLAARATRLTDELAALHAPSSPDSEDAWLDPQ